MTDWEVPEKNGEKRLKCGIPIIKKKKKNKEKIPQLTIQMELQRERVNWVLIKMNENENKVNHLPNKHRKLRKKWKLNNHHSILCMNGWWKSFYQ